ncbi:MAG TPA: hypothetical protein VGR79_03660 [Stellaceae bacterium]|nr:hypothetical protein [Stellaceae bacterium]
MRIESSAPDALLIQFLAWIAARPRRYGETMEAWRTSCPRLPVWEDAVEAGLVEIVAGSESGMRACEVRLTAAGRARLGGTEG